MQCQFPREDPDLVQEAILYNFFAGIIVMKRKFIFSFLIFSTLGIAAQKAVIPFYLNEINRIILQYPIKNNMLNLCFDSAFPLNILDSALAKRLDFAVSNNSKVDSITTAGNITFGVNIPIGEQVFKQDSIFWGIWMNSNMKETAPKLELGENIDGIVGYCSDYKLELDFQKNTLKVWDSLPKKYLEAGNLVQVKLVDSDYGGTKLYRHGVHPLCIKSEMTFLDTLNLYPNMIIDTGNPQYLCLEVFESPLLNKLVEFRRMKAEFQNTTNLRIPELEIDTSFNKINVFPHLEANALNPYRSSIGGSLGVSFLRQYKRVILDRKNQVAWFDK